MRSEEGHRKQRSADDERSIPARVWGGAGLLSVGRVWATLCTATVLMVLARRLPGGEFGRYTFYLALFLLLDGLADFGTGTAAVQRSAHDSRLLPAAIAAGRRIRAVTSAACCIAVAGHALLLPAGERLWVLFAALYPLSRVPELSSVVFAREMRWGVPVAVRLSTATLRLVLALTLWRFGVHAFGPYLAAHVGALALGNLVLYRFAHLRLTAVEGERRPLAGLLGVAAPLGLAAVCQQAYFYVDNLFVRGLRGDEELGHYNGAVRIMTFLVMVAAHATTVAMPWLARRHHAQELRAATSRLSLPMFSAACLVLGALWPWSTRILRTVFGDDFAAAGPSLRWLLVASAIIYAGAGWLTAVVAMGRTRAVLVLTGGALLVNVVGNGLLVPTHGMEGAAIATVATELLVAAGALVLVRRSPAAPSARPLLWFVGPALFVLAAGVSGLLS